MVVAVAALAGCNPTSENPAGGGDKKGVIAYSTLTLSNPFFKVIGDHMTTEAALHGYEAIVIDPSGEVKKQANQIDDFIAQEVTAIVITPCDRKSVGPAIKRANEKGIPVFTVDAQCAAEGVEIAGHVGTDNFQGGQLAGKAMMELLGENGGKVLVLDFKTAHSCVLRVNGFKEEIDRHNKDRDSGKIEIAAELNGGGSRDQGYKTTADALQTHPDLAAVFAINDPSALGAYAAIKEASKLDQVQIIGFDGQIDGKQAIRDGKIYADPIQFPDRMGAMTVQQILKHLAGEEYEKITLIPTALYKKADADKDPDLK